MPRIESIKVAGYFPTPAELLPSLASTLTPAPGQSYPMWNVLDPCAGDAAAVAGLCKAWEGIDDLRVQWTAIEMEAKRAAAAKRPGWPHRAFHGDALNAVREVGYASVLWLNPPYDHHATAKRLEHLFLETFTPWLVSGSGWLLYLVPFHVLKVSASFLAREFLEVRAWRLPDPFFDTFRQVLVIGRRAKAPVHDAAIEAMLLRAGSNADVLPVLPPRCQTPAVVAAHPQRDLELSIYRINVPQAAASFRLFDGAASGTDKPVSALMGAAHETAMPPKPTHVALALSSGMFNGHRIEPSDPSRFPPLLAKGAFLRRSQVIKERKNSKGETTSVVEIERPQLEATILRLDTFAFHRLASGTTPTGSNDLADWNVADLLVHYGPSLANLMANQFPPIHDPLNRHAQLALPRLARTPFKAQAQAIMAALKLIAIGRNPIFDAEVGTGKSTMALYVAAALMPQHHARTKAELARVGFDSSRLPLVRKVLILCPPHLLTSWEDQIAAVRPGTAVKCLRTVADLNDEAEVYLLSRETAKLGPGIKGVEGRCPRCGGDVGSAKTNASSRKRCKNKVRSPRNRFAKCAQFLAAALVNAAPTNPHVLAHLPGAALRRRAGRLTGDGPVVQAPALRALEILTDRYPSDPFAVFRIMNKIAIAMDQRAVVARFLNVHGRNTWQDREALDELRREPPPDEERSLMLLLEAIEEVHSLAEYDDAICGEPLFYATPHPRRYPLATFIARRRPEMFDLVVCDESHEYNQMKSAQSKSMHRLTGLSNVPTLMLTGSLMGGYASSLFSGFFSVSKEFRKQFARTDQPLFVKRYGYAKLCKEVKRESSFGSCTDREIGKVRQIGEAPGVLPDFVMRYLLPTALVVHKADLDLELPPRTEEPVPVPVGDDLLDDDLLGEYKRLQDALIERINADRFGPLTGKLLGALVELPSYLDRCTDDLPPFVLQYPEHVGGEIIDRGMQFPASYRTPKERFLLETIAERLDNDERILVFLRHTGTAALPNRLMRLIREITPDVAWLNTARVPTAKREIWINSHVLKKGVRVLLVNPNAVRTGLNNLVAFSSAVWHELDYSATTYRQANGRLHRIGQVRPVSILMPFVEDTIQATAVELVAKKVSASLQVDGLDIRAALEAAGAGDDDGLAAALSIGQLVHEQLTAA